MTPPLDPAQTEAEIARIVDELRAEIPSSAPSSAVPGDDDALIATEGGDATAGWSSVDIPITTRPGPLAPVRRLFKRIVHKAVRTQMEGLAGDIRRITRLRESERAGHEAFAAEVRRELAALRDRLGRVERVDRPARPAAAPAAQAAEPAPSTPAGNELDYFAFEGLLRGSTDEIAERQADYVALFADVDDILDIGCGRGELIDLLRAAGKKARGVDINEDMVDACRRRGLDVELGDGIAAVAALPAESLGGIAALQVVEHLDPPRLTALLAACHRALRANGVLLLETINPVTLSALRNYFADLTHAQPLVPETLKFLVEGAGFREARIEYRSPLPEVARLRHVTLLPALGEDAQAASDRNIDLLNAALFSHQDYAVIARA